MRAQLNIISKQYTVCKADRLFGKSASTAQIMIVNVPETPYGRQAGSLARALPAHIL